MAQGNSTRSASAAKVDYLIGERGERIELPDGTSVRNTGDSERAIGGTGPASWWQLGLIALGAVALVLLVMQLLSGGAQTDMVPGTPTVQTQN